MNKILKTVLVPALLLSATLSLAGCSATTLPAANTAPVADFTVTPASGPAALRSATTNTSSDADAGDTLTWDWDWGDGSAHSRDRLAQPHLHHRGQPHHQPQDHRQPRRFQHQNHQRHRDVWLRPGAPPNSLPATARPLSPRASPSLSAPHPHLRSGHGPHLCPRLASRRQRQPLRRPGEAQCPRNSEQGRMMFSIA